VEVSRAPSRRLHPGRENQEPRATKEWAAARPGAEFSRGCLTRRDEKLLGRGFKVQPVRTLPGEGKSPGHVAQVFDHHLRGFPGLYPLRAQLATECRSSDRLPFHQLLCQQVLLKVLQAG
jgi:hypothetical protein